MAVDREFAVDAQSQCWGCGECDGLVEQGRCAVRYQSCGEGWEEESGGFPVACSELLGWGDGIVYIVFGVVVESRYIISPALGAKRQA